MNYPGLGPHVEQHRFFAGRVSELDRKGGEATTGEMLPFLRDWFLGHILEEDRRFVPYVKFMGLP
jgi:hemerythrin